MHVNSGAMKGGGNQIIYLPGTASALLGGTRDKNAQ